MRRHAKAMGQAGFQLDGGMGWHGSVSNTCQTRRQADPMCQRLVPQAAPRRLACTECGLYILGRGGGG